VVVARARLCGPVAIVLVGWIAGLSGAARGADIRGRVTLVNPVSRDEPKGDLYGGRAAQMPGKMAQLESRSEVQNVVIFIKGRVDSPDGKPWPPPREPVKVLQINTSFVPRVQSVIVGQRVEFQNQDPLFHNVFSLSKTAPFDLGRFPAPESKEMTFLKPGPVKVFCDIHSHMKGVVLVLPHPFFASPGQQGSYEIKGLPPGDYTLVAWHDLLQPQSRKIRISSESQALEADFDL